MSISAVVDAARHLRLDFGDGVFAFTFYTSDGDEWEGCLEEWIGNGDAASDGNSTVRYNDRDYVEIGSSGGGADIVFVRDDGAICYLNDYDQRMSEVAVSLEDFVGILRRPA